MVYSVYMHISMSEGYKAAWCSQFNPFIKDKRMLWTGRGGGGQKKRVLTREGRGIRVKFVVTLSYEGVFYSGKERTLFDKLEFLKGGGWLGVGEKKGGREREKERERETEREDRKSVDFYWTKKHFLISTFFAVN